MSFLDSLLVDPSKLTNAGFELMIKLFGLGLLVFGAYAIFLFTRALHGPIEGEAGDSTSAAAKDVRAIVRCGYVTILVLMAAATFPFFVPGFPEAYPGNNSPIQILKACTNVAEEGEPRRCVDARRQWVFNIGGVVEPRRFTVAFADSGELNQAFEQTGSKMKEAIHKVNEVFGDGKSPAAGMAVMTIKGVPSQLELTGIPIVSGGLVVPYYMMVIALIGGCIGMTRRLPELQMRGAPHYPDLYERNKAIDPTLKPPLESVQVREFVIFQVMQAVFAPFLALVAFAMLDPADIAGIVAIGFIAGFASEPILLQIRKLAERRVALPSVGSAPVPSTAASAPPAAAVAGRNGAVPLVRELEPNSVTVGTAHLSVTIRGADFPTDAVVQVDGDPRATEIKGGGTEAVFELTPDDVAAPGDKRVIVVGPAPEHGTSDPLILRVTPEGGDE